MAATGKHFTILDKTRDVTAQGDDVWKFLIRFDENVKTIWPGGEIAFTEEDKDDNEIDLEIGSTWTLGERQVYVVVDTQTDQYIRETITYTVKEIHKDFEMYVYQGPVLDDAEEDLY